MCIPIQFVLLNKYCDKVLALRLRGLRLLSRIFLYWLIDQAASECNRSAKRDNPARKNRANVAR